MKVKDLKNQAVAVETKGVVELNDGDVVLVGIKCVYNGGQFIPISRTFKLAPKMFELCEEGEIIPIKRINHEPNPTPSDKVSGELPRNQVSPK